MTMGPRKRDWVTVSVDARKLKADAAAVDALARIALLTQRCGWRLRLRNASTELVDLIELAGLSEVLRR